MKAPFPFTTTAFKEATMPRGGSILRNIPEGTFTTKRFAQRVGVSPDTIKKWRDNGYLPAEDHIQFGEVRVPLYTEMSVPLAFQLKNGLGTLADRAKAFKEAS